LPMFPTCIEDVEDYMNLLKVRVKLKNIFWNFPTLIKTIFNSNASCDFILISIFIINSLHLHADHCKFIVMVNYSYFNVFMNFFPRIE
jgi:hypothetical protein